MAKQRRPSDFDETKNSIEITRYLKDTVKIKHKELLSNAAKGELTEEEAIRITQNVEAEERDIERTYNTMRIVGTIFTIASLMVAVPVLAIAAGLGFTGILFGLPIAIGAVFAVGATMWVGSNIAMTEKFTDRRIDKIIEQEVQKGITAEKNPDKDNKQKKDADDEITVKVKRTLTKEEAERIDAEAEASLTDNGRMETLRRIKEKNTLKRAAAEPSKSHVQQVSESKSNSSSQVRK